MQSTTREEEEKLYKKTAMKEIMRDVLGISRERLEDSAASFQDMGGDSLSALRVVSLVKERLNVEVEVSRVLGTQETMEEMCEKMAIGRREAKRIGESPEELVKKAMKEDLEKGMEEIRQVREKKTKREEGRKGKEKVEEEQVENVVVSGVTGFVGAFLLAELVKTLQGEGSKKKRLYCLVRAKDQIGALERVIESQEESGLLTRQQVVQIAEEGKLVVLPSRLGEKWLGFETEEAFEQLGKQIDVVYHNGALVNHVLPYVSPEMRNANVKGTVELLKLVEMSERPRVTFNYVSTISVVLSPEIVRRQENPLMIPESLVRAEANEEDLSLVARGMGGYEQGKWVSEILLARTVNEAVQEGRKMQGKILRLGMVSWSSLNGRANEQDWLTRLVKGIITLGKAPIATSSTFDLIPVNAAAQILVALGEEEATTTSSNNVFVYHIVGDCAGLSKGRLPFKKLVELLSWHKLEKAEGEGETEAKVREMIQGQLSGLQQQVYFKVWWEYVLTEMYIVRA